MKKILAMILAALMLMSVGAYAAKDESLPKVGRLEATAVDGCEYREHIDTAHSDDPKVAHVYYNNLSAMLMDLNSNKIISIGVDILNYFLSLGRAKQKGLAAKANPLNDKS